jgi:alpha-methylacyl-CoA racemase
LLGGAAPFYRCYRCADGRDIAVGSLEPQFFRELLERIAVPESQMPDRGEPSQWPDQAERLASLFLTRTRAEWCEILEGTDACFAPVLTLTEAAQHPHMVERGAYQEIDGVLHAVPAPRFSRTPGAIRPRRAASAGEGDPADLWTF